MSLLRYAASGILRNRRRTFSSILGVLLAVTFIAGTFIAIDSSARATLDADLSTIAGDYSYAAYPPSTASPTSANGNGSTLRAALAAVSGVQDVSVYRQVTTYMGAFEVANPAANQSVSLGQMWGVDPYDLPYALRQATLSGSILLPNGTLVLDSQTANMIQARVGDPILLEYHMWNGTGYDNYSMAFTLGGTLEFPSASYGPMPYPLPGPYYYYGNMAVVNLRDLPWVLDRLNLASANSLQVQGEVWIDRNRFVDPYDIPSTTFQLTRLQRTLSQAMLAAGYSGSVNDNLAQALQSFSMLLTLQRIQYLLLSFPVILLGLYLGAVGVDLGHAERRREIGVLKTRGASRRQIALLLVTEALLGGLVAAVLGLLLGLGLSRLLIAVVTPFGTAASYGTVSLTPETVIVVAVLSILFMGVASYRSARRTSSLPIIETLRYYAPGETRLHYNPVLDIIMLGYGIAVYAVDAYALTNPSNFFTIMLAFVFIASLPVAPILIVIGAVRLLTRSTGKVYEKMALVLRPVAKNLEHVISRNLLRNPRRSSNIAIIIALGLAFGIFVTSSLASSQAMQVESLRASVGADMSVQVPFMTNLTQEMAFGGNVSQVDGVNAVSPVLSVDAQTPSGTYYGSAQVVALDPSTYFSVSNPASFYFEDPATASAAQDILSTPDRVLITGNYAKSAALQVGDLLPLTMTTYQNYTPEVTTETVTVGGIVRFLPGTSGGSFFGTVQAPDAIYGSLATLQKFLTANSGVYYGGDHFLVSLKPGVDATTVQSAIYALGASGVTVFAQQLSQMTGSILFGSYLGFIEMEIAFIVVILTAGLGLITYAASLERTVEFAGITARGSSGWQTAGLLVGEAFVIMLLGVLLGLGVGLLTGYLTTSITAPSYGGLELIVPTLFVFPVDGLLLVLLAPVAMLGTALLVAWRIARMNVARVLKMRGG